MTARRIAAVQSSMTLSASAAVERWVDRHQPLPVAPREPFAMQIAAWRRRRADLCPDDPVRSGYGRDTTWTRRQRRSLVGDGSSLDDDEMELPAMRVAV